MGIVTKCLTRPGARLAFRASLKKQRVLAALYFKENLVDERDEKALSDIEEYGCHVLKVMEGDGEP
ncbi:hypothetical protein R0J87_20270, partial [Halomonas sp. SIMBA_159]